MKYTYLLKMGLMVEVSNEEREIVGQCQKGDKEKLNTKTCVRV